MRIHVALCAVLTAGLTLAGSAVAQEPPCVVDADLNALITVDPTTGDRTVISGCVDVACTSIIGTGTNFVFPRGIYFEPDGQILVVDGARTNEDPVNLKTIFRVDHVGNRAVVSSSDLGNEVGTGPAFNTLFDVILAANGDLIVADPESDTIFRVDPVSGNRTIASSNTVGTGPTMTFPGDIALESPGTIVSTEGGNDQILRIDLSTGNRTIVSSTMFGQTPVGSGISFSNLGGLTLTNNGDIIVADEGAKAVISVDPITGDRTELSGPLVGTGPTLVDPFGVDVDSAGNIYVSDGTLGLIKIDPATGNRVVHSSSTVGAGVPITLLRDVRMEPDPILGVPLGSPVSMAVIAMLMMATAMVMLSRRTQTDV
ncbi:MAG: hypothetical protein JRE71_01080 [Deltaproteobacteria bacterium]|nr:hypothetical protein [Deltaproteobacteria bacterium]